MEKVSLKELRNFDFKQNILNFSVNDQEKLQLLQSLHLNTIVI